MRALLLSLLVLPALTLTGCGKPPPSADPRYVEPTLGLANSVRQDVMALRGSNEVPPGATIDEFLENMEGYEKRAVGQNKETYDAIMKAAQELKQLKDRKAGRAEIMKKIDEMMELTKKLPSGEKR